MTSQPRAALLIDADNFHDPVHLAAAHAQLRQYTGVAPLCHVHGSLSRLQNLAPIWRGLGARLMPALPLDKNTTDAALIVDAMALYLRDGVRLLAIASGDADFAPLAAQLRSEGCQLWCFTRTEVAFDGVDAYYDRVLRFASAPAPLQLAKPQPALPRPSTTLPSTLLPADPQVLVERVLTAYPALRDGQPQPMSQVVAALRQQHVLGKKAKSTAWFGALAPHFVLEPVAQPNRVQYRSASTTPSLPPADPQILVERVLTAYPALRDGQPQPMSQVVAALRQQHVLGKKAKSTAWFGALAPHFVLEPVAQPNRVQYRPSGEQSALPSVDSAALALAPRLSATARTGVTALVPAPLAVVRHPRRNAVPLRSLQLAVLRKLLFLLAARKVSAEDVLRCVPELRQGQLCALGEVACRLREHGWLHASRSALDILVHHPQAFELHPAHAPQTVRWRGPTAH